MIERMQDRPHFPFSWRGTPHPSPCLPLSVFVYLHVPVGSSSYQTCLVIESLWRSLVALLLPYILDILLGSPLITNYNSCPTQIFFFIRCLSLTHGRVGCEDGGGIVERWAHPVWKKDVETLYVRLVLCQYESWWTPPSFYYYTYKNYNVDIV